MARIDSHQHFWHYDPVAYDWINAQMDRLKSDFLPEHLAPHLAAMNIDGCIALQARQTEEETRFLLAFAEEYSFVKGVVGWLDLQAADVAERIAAWQPFGALKGIRHIIQGEPDPAFILREEFIRGVRQLGEAGLSYDILVFERQLPNVIRFLERCPDQPMVLDHLGKPVIAGGPSREWQASIRAISEHPNVYCKVSGLVTEADWAHWSAADFRPFLDVVTEAFGPQRLMIGSDWPVCLLAAPDYHTVLEIIEQHCQDWSAADRAALWGETATHFYNL